MSPINTLAGGYKGGSPRVRSENSKKHGDAPKQIDVDDLVNRIQMWYADGNLTSENMQLLKDEINKIVI